MKKWRSWLILMLVLVLSAGTAVAEKSTNSEAKDQTIQGCLSMAASDFILRTTDVTQRQYRLTGDTGPLATHVGHMITVTGKVMVPARVTYGASDWDRNGGWRAIGADATTILGTLRMDNFEDISSTGCREF